MKSLNAHPDTNHLAWLDGIRGLAILLVFIGHYFIRFYLFQFGWIGLNLFFILSGYLITSRLFVHFTTGTAKYFRNFYARRVLRIFPLYYGCLACVFIILPLFYHKYETNFGSLSSIQGWYWSYLSNWRIISFGLPSNPLLFHFWSLAVEEQYYLIWPMIFLLVGAFRKRLLFISLLLCLSIIFRIGDFGFKSAYYNTLTAAEPLLLGSLLCILERSGQLGKLYKYLLALSVVSAIMLVIIFIHDPNPFPDNPWVLIPGYTNIDLIWVAVISSMLLKTKLAKTFLKIFQSKFMVWLGIYSYGIYVFHWIVLQLFVFKWESMLEKAGQPEWISYGCSRLLGIGATLAAAIFSFKYFESRFLALKNYFTGGPVSIRKFRGTWKHTFLSNQIPD
jgi:peptidoglycan/LPS O-acetylase OafA/YrhL